MTNEEYIHWLIKKIDIYENVHFVLNSILTVLMIVVAVILIWSMWRGRRK